MNDELNFEQIYTEALNGGAPIDEDGALELTVELRPDERTQPARENW